MNYLLGKSSAATLAILLAIPTSSVLLNSQPSRAVTPSDCVGISLQAEPIVVSKASPSNISTSATLKNCSSSALQLTGTLKVFKRGSTTVIFTDSETLNLAVGESKSVSLVIPSAAVGSPSITTGVYNVRLEIRKNVSGPRVGTYDGTLTVVP